MADTTISALTQGTPAGNSILPYSTGSNTLGVPVSAILQNAGNVGIGIDNPVRRLEVNGAIKSYSAGGNLIFNADSGYEWWTGSWNDFVSYQVTRRRISDGEGTSHLTINTSGNVGIGTITPSTKLDVNGTIKATGLQVPGAVIQVICAIKTDISVTTSTTFVDIPGLSASITPKSASNKVLFTGNVLGACNNNAFVRIMRSIGGAAYSQVYTSTSTVGNRTPVSFGDFYMVGNPGSGAGKQNTSIFLDTPNTTDEVIYKLQYKTITASNPFSINSTYYDANASYQAIGASSLTLQEIAG